MGIPRPSDGVGSDSMSPREIIAARFCLHYALNSGGKKINEAISVEDPFTGSPYPSEVVIPLLKEYVDAGWQVSYDPEAGLLYFNASSLPVKAAQATPITRHQAQAKRKLAATPPDHGDQATQEAAVRLIPELNHSIENQIAAPNWTSGWAYEFVCPDGNGIAIGNALADLCVAAGWERAGKALGPTGGKILFFW